MNDNVTLLCRQLDAHIATVSKNFTPLPLVAIGTIRAACTPMAQVAVHLERVLIFNGCPVNLVGLPSLSKSACRHTVEFYQNVGVCRLLLAHVNECDRCQTLIQTDTQVAESQFLIGDAA